MSLKNPFKHLPPHGERRLTVHFIIILLVAVIVYCATSCRPSRGCKSTQGLSGYGWMKCRETKKVFVLDKDGAIVCTYYDSK